MSQTTSHHARTRARTPFRELSSPQLRAVRKEMLLLRAEVERSEFVHARVELRHGLARFGWLKLLVPGFFRGRPKTPGKGVNASLTDWLSGHPLVSSLMSIVLARPIRATLAAGTKPLLKWGSLGVAAWAGYRLLTRMIRHEREPSETQTDDTP